MAEQRSTTDQVLDLLVYAPLGLALTAAEELPKLAEKGRQQLANQVPTARAIGQLAVDQSQKQVERMARRAAERLADLGLVAECPPSGPSSRAKPEPGAKESHRPRTSEPRAAAAGSTVDDVVEARPVAADLAIPGYDTLSAPQVVQRLDGLSPEELEAVRVYESATRRRKTILTRVAQLQGS